MGTGNIDNYYDRLAGEVKQKYPNIGSTDGVDKPRCGACLCPAGNRENRCFQSGKMTSRLNQDSSNSGVMMPLWDCC